MVGNRRTTAVARAGASLDELDQRPMPGSLLRPDPRQETDALARAATNHDGEDGSGHSGNGRAGRARAVAPAGRPDVGRPSNLDQTGG